MIRKHGRQVREQDKLLRKIPPEIIAEICRKDREKDWKNGIWASYQRQ